MGIWTSDLPELLLWTVCYPLVKNEDLPDTPSWTWASMMGPVILWSTQTSDRLEDMCDDIVLESSGKLVIRSFVKQGSCGRMIDYGRPLEASEWWENPEWWEDPKHGLPPTDTLVNGPIYFIKDPDRRCEEDSVGLAVFDSAVHTDEFHCLFLTRLPFQGKYVYFSLLLKLSSSDANGYRRIGTGVFPSISWSNGVASQRICIT